MRSTVQSSTVRTGRSALAPVMRAFATPDETGPARAEVVRNVRDRVRAGRYRPSDEAVAEVLLAWLAPPAGAKPVASPS